MKLGKIHQIMRYILVVSFLVILSGCDKFVKHESENLAPFAQQTIDLIGALEYSLSEDHIFYLREIHDYMDVKDPYRRYFALENQVSSMLAAVTTYSLQIVAISEQNISENEKANKLADVVETLLDMILKDQELVNNNLEVEDVQGALVKVRQSEEYLAALRLLLPTINEFSAHGGRVLDELRIEKQKLALLIDEAIDKKYASALELHAEMRLARDGMYKTLVYLSKYSVSGDKADFDKMKSYGMFPVVMATKNKTSLSVKELYRLHKDITDNLRIVNENYEQLTPDIREYHEHHQELADIVEFKEDAIRESRATFILWSRAYQKMASGKTDPAEWFDISESGSLIFGLAKKAAGI